MSDIHFNDKNFDDLFNNFFNARRQTEKKQEEKPNPTSSEEKKEEKTQNKYIEGVENRFLTYARSLPGREYETINDPLVEIVGEIEDGKVVNLKVLPQSKAFSEGLKYVFSDSNKQHFSITKDGQISIVSDSYPEQIKQLISFIVTPTDEKEKEALKEMGIDLNINIKII